MIDITKFLIDDKSSVKKILEVINENLFGICFVHNEDNTILGSITDGDIRRLLIKGGNVSEPVTSIMNKNFVKLPSTTNNTTILNTLSDKIKAIPLLDSRGRLVDIATIKNIRKIPVSAPWLGGNELSYVADCIDSTWISSSGKYITKFQELFQEYCHMPHALAVSNGTVALHLALEALEIGNGDEVIVPNLTFAASINSILYSGATPVLADIDKDTLNIDIESIHSLITEKTKAIMPVHLYGYPCDMDNIMLIAKKHNLLIIEDCAEALGSKYKGQPIGSFGDAATFSFFGNKTITTGEGGMVLFKDEKVANRAAVLKDHGMNKKKRYWHDFVGYNYRMTNMQAAVGVAQMEQLDKFIERKRAISQIYSEGLRAFSFLRLPKDSKDYYNTFWLYTMIIDANIDIDRLIEQLLLEGVDSRPIFFPLDIMPPYKKFRTSDSLSGTRDVEGRGISLPSSTSLTDKEAHYVIDKVVKCINNALKQI